MNDVLEKDRQRHGCGDDKRKDKTITVIVNGREKEVPKRDKLTFDELIALAFDNPPQGEFICFTITYRKGPRPKREGTVPEGGAVRPKEGMIFNVTATDKS